MSTLPAPPLPERRFGALALTAAVHVLLLFAWQATRRLPDRQPERDTRRIQWINLLPERARPPAPARTPERAPLPAPARVAPAPAITILPPVPVAPPPAPPASAAADAPAPSAPAAPGAAVPSQNSGPLVQQALREAGAVGRALRKENNPYIVAPPDSPQIRMQKRMQAAHEMVPNAWYEAPKMDELANPRGNGARDVRVRGAFGTYCISNASAGIAAALDPTASGSTLKTTTCLKGEDTSSPQEWKTARDP